MSSQDFGISIIALFIKIMECAFCSINDVRIIAISFYKKSNLDCVSVCHNKFFSKLSHYYTKAKSCTCRFDALMRYFVYVTSYVLEHLNSIYPKIQFTMKLEFDNFVYIYIVFFFVTSLYF